MIVMNMFISLQEEEEEVGRIVKLVYSYVKDVNNGYILAQKGVFKPGDHFRARGHECVITERKWI